MSDPVALVRAKLRDGRTICDPDVRGLLHRFDVLHNYVERIRDLSRGQIYDLAVEALENKP